MTSGPDIVEKWIERMVETRPEQASALRIREPDPFRNPIGYAVRKSLAKLWEELQCDMDPIAIDSALDAIIRIHAVQDMPPSQAVGFVVLLRPILREQPGVFDLVFLENRIDQLVLSAFDKYMQCRDQIMAARLHERERLTGAHRRAGKAEA